MVFKTTHLGRRREVLRLYRDVLKTANAFYWPDKNGEPWSTVLKRNARKEFEEARHEKDPLIITRLIVVGQDCIMKTQENFTQMEETIKKRVATTRNDQPGR